MRHTYSADEAHFATPEAATEWLGGNCTRNQRLTLARAIDHWFAIRAEPSVYPDALHVAAQLKYMRADAPILIASLFGSDVSTRRYPDEFVHEHYGQDCARLVRGVRWLNELTVLDGDALGAEAGGGESREQAERLRRMVLSMVEDIRVVLVKLAYRTQRLYGLAKSEAPERIAIARETLSIYAPLANRLGLGQLKWELEDVAFRIVEPEAYRRIARALEENRAARESYIESFVENLEERLALDGLYGASVTGRPKHIYSIWKKMRAKHIEFSDLFDVRAVRVLVKDLQQCYGVLGIVHGTWQPIGREFDDYIANPKDNGYRSLHTAVIGPSGKAVEVQIRTREMDDDAENGVAAHWAYKEGGPVDLVLQKNINALRQLLDDNDDEQLVEGFSQQLDSNRVYVFTPKGEVIDMVAGATPLDFAYHIHSEIGHRCRGAKIDGSIVPLTTTLSTGDQVEILTTREPGPSRDWLNKSLGYVNSSRARAKVRAWFNQQDHGQHVADGRAMLDRELKRLKSVSIPIDAIVKRLKYEAQVELFAALGRNEVTMAQIVGAIDQLSSPAARPLTLRERLRRRPKDAPAGGAAAGAAGGVGHGLPGGATGGATGGAASRAGAIEVRGVGNLLTQIAPCCRPVPYDAIVGFITRGKGVSIHRADCGNVLNLREFERERLIEVDWGQHSKSRYRVEIRIDAYDRQGLLRDVSAALSSQDVDVIGVHTESRERDQTADMRITMNVSNMEELANVMDRVRQLRNVRKVERVV